MLGNMPSELINHIARLGGPNVTMRLASTSRSMREATSARSSIAAARDALLRRLRQARRAYALSIAGMIPQNRPFTYYPLENLGRIGKTDYVSMVHQFREPGGRIRGMPVAYFKTGGHRISVSVMGVANMYRITVRVWFKNPQGGWMSEKVIEMQHVKCASHANGARPTGKWLEGQKRLDAVTRTGYGHAVNTFLKEMKPAMAWC